MLSTKTHRRLTGVVAVACAGALLGSASPASAYQCSASAVRGTVLSQTGLEPVVAGGGSDCRTDAASLNSLPAPLAGVAAASTDLTGPAGTPAQQRAQSQAGLENFSVGALRSVPITLPAAQIPDGLNALQVPLPAGVLGLPSAITVNALPAAEALVPVRQLPDVALAAVKSLRSIVGAQCLSGLPNLVGASAVDGLTGLGQSIPTDAPVDKIVTLLDAQSIPLSGINVNDVQLPAGLSFDTPVTGPVLKTAVQQVIAGLPPIVLPATVGEVQTTPAEQTTGDGSIEQHALRMTVSAAGKTVADLVLGIAKVATGGLSCAEAAAAPVVNTVAPEAPKVAPVQPASQLAVSCSKASVTLVNVIDQDSHVTLIGAADKKLIGKKVDIVSTWNGKRVATSKVGRSGFFRAKAPMPSQSLRYSSRARYMAVVGKEQSLPLKLHRRMRFSTLTHHGSKLTLKGMVFGPRNNDVIEIRQAISCTKDIVVKRIHADRNGHWSVTLKAPKGTRAATYRATTSVRNAGSGRQFPTFTLPGYVSL